MPSFGTQAHVKFSQKPFIPGIDDHVLVACGQQLGIILSVTIEYKHGDEVFLSKDLIQHGLRLLTSRRQCSRTETVKPE